MAESAQLNILINAASIKEGGSSVVLLRLLDEFVRQRPHYCWHVAVHPSMVPALPVRPEVSVLPVDAAVRSPLHLRLWYERILPGIVRERSIDLVYSQTNYLPTRRLMCPTLLLVQHAGHFSDEFRRLMEAHAGGAVSRWAFRATGRWVRRSIASASRVTVQTESLAEAIRREVPVPAERITVVPHGPGLVEEGASRQLRNDSRAWEIGYVSKFGVQKNFDVLLRAVASLRERHALRLTLTLNERDPGFARIAARIAELGLTETVRNLGELDRGRMQSIYDEFDVFVFPSLCESFGFPLVEAMARGLPVIGADIPSTREIGGTALEYFSPHDDRALADAIAAVMGDADRYALQSGRVLERSRHYSWSRSAEMNLSMIDRTAGKNTQLGTAAHYESHPFEFMTDADAARIESLQPSPFRRFVERHLHPGDTVADVGCGPGRATLYLLNKGCAVTAVDLTQQALSLTRGRGPAAGFVRASNLDLPFAAESFDAVVSDGVIHHTPDPYRALIENMRVLRKGGHLYLGVYKRNRYYYYLYTYVGRPVRWLEHRRWGRALVNGTLLPVYYLAHLVKSRGKRTWRGAKNFFYDYIITPRATFHTREEVEEWGRRNGLEVLEYHPNVGNVHAFFFRKR